MRRFALGLMAAAMLLTASPASAITYGQPDGNRHPNVGALTAVYQGDIYPYCSGTLIAPAVFLTAAHCDSDGARVSVMFDERTANASKLYTGTFVADPRYTHSQDDPHDIAVVLLDKPITHLTPAKLPTKGLFDRVAKGQQFTAVGYGGQEAVNQPGGPVNAYLDNREFSVSTFSALNQAFMRLSQNPATGDSGTCYGDSGGPNFLGAGAVETPIVAGTTITGDALCKSTNVIYRLDTDSARSFLGRFVALP